MSVEITLYVDYRSPFSYLAKDEAYELERDYDVELTWQPYNTDFEGAYGGSVDQRSERDWRKIRYLYRDARRLANRRGLTIRGTRKIFDPTLAHAGMLYAQALDVFRPYHDRVLELFWKQELDIENPLAIQNVLAEVGADPTRFSDYLNHEGPRALQAIQAAAEAKGVFGVPTFILADELFWGIDRLWLLREFLLPSMYNR